MSVRVMAQVWQASCPSHTAKLVLLAIADNSDDHGKAWPSITTLSAKCNLCRRSVIENLETLEGAGLISTKRQQGRGNVYSVKLVQEMHGCTSDTSAGDAPPSAGDALVPVQEMHGTRAGDAPKPSRTINGTTKEPPKAKSSPVFDPLKLDLPHGNQFREAWKLWCDHRKELGGKHNLKPTSTSQQLKRLGAMSEGRAVETIEHTVANSWVGLREPEPDKSHQNGRPHEQDLPEILLPEL